MSARPQSLNEWLELLEVRHPTAIDLGLDRCRAVWQRMGSPRPGRGVVVVAGTNGKGSTVATICGLLDGLGYRYGSYTTPHLFRYNERVQLQGQPVSDAALLDAFERVEAARMDTSLTYFEFGTLAAFGVLAGAGLDYAVMEIGLGGRLDAVNLLDADVAVITPIGLDHQEYLGSDLDSIGREKAGVIRPGQVVICGEPQPPASVQAIAHEQGACLRRLGIEFGARLAGTSVRFEADGLVLDLPQPALRGPHQVGNMATGLAAVLALLPGAATDPAGLARGLQAVRLPGRLQRLAERPALWIDVGHNPLAAHAVATALEEIRADAGMQACRCVIGMLADKDAAATVAELRRVIDCWYCASLPGSRGQAGAQLAARIAAAVGSSPLQVLDSVEAALEAALADASPDDGVLVFGSFLTAAAAANYFRGSCSREPPRPPATSRGRY
jgi:dihydrofolate synthase/folylpolyglutamate synthase